MVHLPFVAESACQLCFRRPRRQLQQCFAAGRQPTRESLSPAWQEKRTFTSCRIHQQLFGIASSVIARPGMAKKRGKTNKIPAAMQTDEWVRATRERIEAQRAQHREQWFESMATLAGQSVLPGRTQEAVRDTRQQQLQAQRQHSGLLATGFEPQRHTSIVCGRPCQVPFSSCSNDFVHATGIHET